jgi:hypothetical protein
MSTFFNNDEFVFRVGGGQPCRLRRGSAPIVDQPGEPQVFRATSRPQFGENLITLVLDQRVNGGSRIKTIRVADSADEGRTAVSSNTRLNVAAFGGFLSKATPPASVYRFSLPGTSLATSVSVVLANAIGDSEAITITTDVITTSAVLVTASPALTVFDFPLVTASLDIAVGMAQTISVVDTG